MHISSYIHNLAIDALHFLPHAQKSIANLARRESGPTSGSRCGPNACEKPTSSSTFTLPIILGAAVPLVGAAILFIILQRRHVRKQREEDANDRHASLDFGLGDVSPPDHSKNHFSQSMVEKTSGLSRRQLSMDLNMNNPYLPSLGSKNSHQSINSLSKPFRQEDPYRPVSELANSDTTSSHSQSKPATLGNKGQPQPRNSGISEMNSTSHTVTNRNISSPSHQNSIVTFPSTPNNQQFPDQSSYPSEPTQAHLQHNFIQSTKRASNGPHTVYPAQYQTMAPGCELELGGTHHQGGAFINGESGGENYKNGETYIHDGPSYPNESGAGQNQPTFSHPRFLQQTQLQQESIVNNQTPSNPFENGNFSRAPQFSSANSYSGQYTEHGTVNPRTNPNRHSISRPLPPQDITETDNPEIRANRIRSFYKEYFEDNSQNPQNEDFPLPKPNDETTYYDPNTNKFILPYAQPVTRRAMTPPPKITPNIPQHMRNGSMGMMNNDRSGWHMSSDLSEPRPQSSSSSRPPREEKKRIPPPVQLDPLPTPSKFHGDVSSMDSTAFTTRGGYRDHGSSRSLTSQTEVQPFSFVKNSHAELSPIPSPHMLRKSGTYSAVGFAPPKKFRDGDSNSDAGSIRSNLSGNGNSRPGIMRNNSSQIDQLPNGVIFTKDSLNSTLKPQWDMNR